jgi:predicted CXXCH cytochrome family protein
MSVGLLASLVVFVTAVAGGALVAQAGVPQATTQPASTQPATTQPAPADLAATPEAEDAAEAWARASLFSGLIGSKHDFTQGGRSGRDLCLPCHTPHLMGVPPPRLDRRATTTQLLRPYRGLGIELTGWSLLCLGCHDGVTAPDVYSSAHAVAVSAQLANSRLGTRGLRSHPVGVEYPSVDERFEPRAAVEAAGLLLADGRIQCTTCHDAHNTGRHGHMLRAANERSRLCVTCHRL